MPHTLMHITDSILTLNIEIAALLVNTQLSMVASACTIALLLFCFRIQLRTKI